MDIYLYHQRKELSEIYYDTKPLFVRVSANFPLSHFECPSNFYKISCLYIFL